MIRPARLPPSHKMPGGKPTQKEPAQLYSMTTPRRGWTQVEDKMNPAPGAALVLDNWFPTSSGIRARGGCSLYATSPDPVVSLFTYKGGTTEKLFAASYSRIYDISANSDPAAMGTTYIGGRSNGDYITEHFGTIAGDYLYAVNGSDYAMLYDGAAWANISDVSPIAITGIATSSLNFVWSFGNRLFFIENSSMNVWYLPVESLGGAAVQLNFSGIFSKGGYLVAGGRWSLDAGDGLGEKCVFISSEGEVAVYQGTDPSSALTWAKVGLYSISKPLGRKAIIKAGADLLIATQTGLIPLSQALARDASALGGAALSAPIADYWHDKADALVGDWHMMKVSETGALMITQPGDNRMLVANMTTGAWCRYTGWDARCMAVFGDVGYFADNVGRVLKMDDGGSDNGEPYTARYLGWHETMGAYSARKTIGQARYAFKTSVTLVPQLKVLTDFDETASTAPATGTSGSPPLWNLTDWDTAYWDGGAPQIALSLWQSVGRSGFVIAPEMQLTFDMDLTPDVELMSIDVTFTLGAVVT